MLALSRGERVPRRVGAGEGSRKNWLVEGIAMERLEPAAGFHTSSVISRSSGILCVNGGPLRERMKAPSKLHGLGDVD